MKLKMATLDGSMIINTDSVTQFCPDADNGGNYTRIEMLTPDGEQSTVVVKHDFYQVTSALATAWSMEEKQDSTHE